MVAFYVHGDGYMYKVDQSRSMADPSGSVADLSEVDPAYNCPHCTKSFLDPRSLYLHVRCHGEKKAHL